MSLIYKWRTSPGKGILWKAHMWKANWCWFNFSIKLIIVNITILSCYESEPSLTIMLIPNTWQTAGYNTWLSHSYVTHLCTITHQCDVSSPRPLLLETPNQSLEILVISNTLGRAEWAATYSAAHFCECITCALPHQYHLLPGSLLRHFPTVAHSPLDRKPKSTSFVAQLFTGTQPNTPSKSYGHPISTRHVTLQP